MRSVVQSSQRAFLVAFFFVHMVYRHLITIIMSPIYWTQKSLLRIIAAVLHVASEYDVEKKKVWYTIQISVDIRNERTNESRKREKIHVIITNTFREIDTRQGEQRRKTRDERKKEKQPARSTRFLNNVCCVYGSTTKTCPNPRVPSAPWGGTRVEGVTMVRGVVG